MVRKATDPNHAMRYRDAEEMLAEFESSLPALHRKVVARSSAKRKSKITSNRRRRAA